MAKTNSRMYTLLVCGENPADMAAKYDMSIQVEPYIKYEYLKAEKMKSSSIKVLERIVQSPKEFQLSEFQIEGLRERLNGLKSMSPFEFYTSLTNGYKYDEDGNAITTENPDGKWVTCAIGENFSNPFILKDGTTSRSARKGEIDWIAMNTQNITLYQRVWELAVDGDLPKNDNESEILDRFAGMERYFSRFKNKEEYVNYNTRFWTYAILDCNGWKDVDDAPNANSWVINFMNTFINKIGDDTLLTIFECSTNDDMLV